MEFETVIGLEVHAQLKTVTKIFCGSSAAYGGEPNQYVDPLTMGMPGSLPVLNRKVVESAIMLGLATNSQIKRLNRFARKHYFYPDLPKGYQISQYEEPICERGHVEIFHNNAHRTIGLTRIHMEEDAGKNMHDARTETSLVDLNRAGVPLLEIVSQPDLRSPDEAAAYARTLRQILRYLDICDGNMDEGSLRVDANVSLRPVGQLKFGTRTEIKNINSFRFLERALEYEIARQLSILKQGGTIHQETRLFDSSTGTTHPMRSKEESADYRYFPDPDLPPLIVEESWVNEIRGRMPKLPGERRKQLTQAFNLSEYDAEVLTAERSFVDYFEEVFNVCKNPKAACNWVTSELFGYLKKDNIEHEFEKWPVKAVELGQLVKLIDEEVISGKIAKGVFEEMYQTGKSAKEIIETRGLRQISNAGEIEKIVADIFDKNPKQVQEFIAGDERLLGFFVGQVMKASKGMANPKIVNEMIAKEKKKERSLISRKFYATRILLSVRINSTLAPRIFF